MIEPSLNADDVARTFRVLRKVDAESVKALRKGLNAQLKPVAADVAKAYPSSPVLSGFMQTYGRWGWDRVVGKVNITPGKSRKGAGANNVVSLSMNYSNATPFVVSLFGQKTTGSTPQSQVLYRQLNILFPGWPKGGRIFYKAFRSKRETVINESTKIINDWSEKVSKELGV